MKNIKSWRMHEEEDEIKISLTMDKDQVLDLVEALLESVKGSDTFTLEIGLIKTYRRN